MTEATSTPMMLRSTLTSPYGRKVRIAADVLGLASRLTLVPADTRDEHDDLRRQNPLGKMPCLVLEDGTAIFDSHVIIEYLQELAGTEILIPRAGRHRYELFTLARLADGITDAALLMVYEPRFRDPEQFSPRWVDHQRGKVMRGLSAFERDLPTPEITIASIGLICALGYLDWRKPVEWRQPFPNLARWLSKMSADFPQVERNGATRPQAPHEPNVVLQQHAVGSAR